MIERSLHTSTLLSTGSSRYASNPPTQTNYFTNYYRHIYLTPVNSCDGDTFQFSVRQASPVRWKRVLNTSEASLPNCSLNGKFHSN
jgi:hypothetical protein